MSRCPPSRTPATPSGDATFGGVLAPRPIVPAAVVIPAHDETDRTTSCLEAVEVAAAHVRVPVAIVVSLDRSTDHSSTDHSADAARAALADYPGGWVVQDTGRRSEDLQCVAEVGDVSAEQAIAMADVSPEHLWLAHTDADSRVLEAWSAQLAHADGGADVVVGTAEPDWAGHVPWQVRHQHSALVQSTRRADGAHGNVDGADPGIRASSFLGVGGCPAVGAGEDTAAVAVLDSLPSHRVTRCEAPVVLTSGRREGRARGGLGDLLRAMSRPDRHHAPVS